MDYKLLPPGNNVPEEVNAIIEIPKGEGSIKYEYRTNGTLIIDRLRPADAPMYPTHYCGIPATQAPDGDPLDVLILGDDKLKSGDVIAVRPVAVFWMTDEKGIDPKIIAVPADSVSDEYRHIQTHPTARASRSFFRNTKKATSPENGQPPPAGKTSRWHTRPSTNASTAGKKPPRRNLQRRRNRSPDYRRRQ